MDPRRFRQRSAQRVDLVNSGGWRFTYDDKAFTLVMSTLGKPQHLFQMFDVVLGVNVFGDPRIQYN